MHSSTPLSLGSYLVPFCAALGLFVSPLPLYIRGESFPSLIRLLRGPSGERPLLPYWIKHPIWIPLPGGLLLPGRKQRASHLRCGLLLSRGHRLSSR